MNDVKVTLTIVLATGQVPPPAPLTLTVSSVSESVKDVKEQLQREHPAAAAAVGGAAKMQLRAAASGVFLKDAGSLAAANVGSGALLELSARSRGGKK